MSKRFVPVAAPVLVGNEKKYVMDCLDSTWISSNGKYLEQFEYMFSEFCQVKYALVCANGTVALHLALLAAGVGPGDEVIIPTFTYVATANAVVYCGARPVLVDAELDSWNMSPSLIRAKITPKTKAIIAVHLYGHPANMDPIMAIAKEEGLVVIEDAAEAHGAQYKGRIVGSIGDIATFSFYGNKIVTTGEGGMVVTNRSDLAMQMRQLRGQGMDLERRYWFPILGYNYRMTNVAAAIGVAQMEKIDWHLSRRREIATQYQTRLGQLKGVSLQPEQPWARNVYWMNCILLSESCHIGRDELMEELKKDGIETRPFFYPMHILPMYKPEVDGQVFPVADHLTTRGLNIPSGATLTPQDVDYVCDKLMCLLDR